MNTTKFGTIASMLCKMLPDSEDQAAMLNALLCGDECLSLTDAEDDARAALFDAIVDVCNADAVQFAQES